MERTKQDRHETPVGVRYNNTTARWDGSLVETSHLYGAHRVPDNQFEALMECAPHDEPLNTCANGTWFEHYLDTLLTPKEKAVIELLYVGGMSGTEAGEFLARQFSKRNKPYSRTYVYKLRDSALAKLRARLVVEETN